MLIPIISSLCSCICCCLILLRITWVPLILTLVQATAFLTMTSMLPLIAINEDTKFFINYPLYLAYKVVHWG